MAASRTAEEASHSFTSSPFSHGRHLRPHGPHLGLSCATWGMGDVGKVKLFSLSTPIHPNSYFFLSSRVLQLLLWKPRLPQSLSCPSMGNCPGQCSQVLWTTAERAGTGSQATAGSTAGTEVCQSITRCTGVRDSFQVPWCMVLDPTTPTEAVLFVDE